MTNIYLHTIFDPHGQSYKDNLRFLKSMLRTSALWASLTLCSTAANFWNPKPFFETLVYIYVDFGNVMLFIAQFRPFWRASRRCQGYLQPKGTSQNKIACLELSKNGPTRCDIRRLLLSEEVGAKPAAPEIFYKDHLILGPPKT